MEVTYENLAAERDLECDRILDFLGVPRRKLKTRMLKQQTRSLPDIVTNYRMLKEHFDSTEWSSFFVE